MRVDEETERRGDQTEVKINKLTTTSGPKKKERIEAKKRNTEAQQAELEMSPKRNQMR